MIGVIADDFSGAAEMAGIGYAAGLRAQLQTAADPDTRTDLLVLDTDSRSCWPEEASRRVEQAVRHLQKADPKIDWIYKKVDSVLRGPIVAELTVLMNLFEIPRVLLIPANPSHGRIVRAGRYFVNQIPLEQTDFANDPEYPARSSDVLERLGLSGRPDAGILKPGQKIPPQGIWVGQAETLQDLQEWAGCLDRHTLAAGAADFFTAILHSKGIGRNVWPTPPIWQPRWPALFVFGSGSDYNRRLLHKAYQQGRKVYRMPEELFSSSAQPNSEDRAVQSWADSIAAALRKEGCAVAAIDRPTVRDPALAWRLATAMADLVKNVLARVRIKDLYIEGGATASTVMRRLEWKHFDVAARPAPGIVQMRPAQAYDCLITVKPGSYPWPEPILNLVLKGVCCENPNSSLD